MSWIESFSFVMRSSFTAIREKIEDPERMLHQLVCDMEEELETVRHSVAAALADEIQIGKEVERTRTEVEQWAARAETALRRGDESSTRQAIEQKLRAEERLATLEKSYASQKTQTEKLQSSYRDLEDKIRQARHKRTLLVARLAQADSTRKINCALDHANGKSAFAEFSRLERRVEREEAMSDAYDRLEGRDPDAAALAAKFSKEEQRAKLEEELEAMKQRLAPSGS
ncbi:PspA/IM30 family protein [Planctomicrobium piriforme]|uniref:Phage shock protein A n=1 Tax=Planctomicrobium piriforme TaxID=1576369 RepID=A0A1I3K7Y3_9PLAN|nr:PspA/IM30 family protein [Planctomicrobium piriforme]SFI68440.1 phage shock protein A [Planctomicrobium piriforme]